MNIKIQRELIGGATQIEFENISYDKNEKVVIILEHGEVKLHKQPGYIFSHFSIQEWSMFTAVISEELNKIYTENINMKNVD